MQNIVFVVPSLSGGGAERVVSVLANKLSERDFKVNVICLLKPEHTYYTSEKVSVFFIHRETKNRLKRNLEKFSDFIRLLKKISPDTIISFTYDCSMITSVANIFINAKLIISERNDPNNDPSRKWLRIIRNFLYNFGDGFVFQTEDAKSYYGKNIQKKSVVIGNPINEKLPLPYEGDREKRIVCVSRLAPQKNIKMLIDAYDIAKKELAEYIVEIYGDGPLKQELLNYIEGKGLSDKIILKGYCTNVYDSILKSSIFVLPSDYEGISNSMLEALALGIPVISTDCPIGGAKMYIKNGKSGILVKVGDVQELSLKIKELAYNEKMRNNFSKESRKIMRVLSADTISREWVDLINKI